MANAKYTPIDSFWAILVPAVVFGVLFYAYHHPGFFGNLVRDVVDPFLIGIRTFIQAVF